MILLSKSLFARFPLRNDLIKRALSYEQHILAPPLKSGLPLSLTRGSTRKIAPQKGRGAARHRTFRAPQFRGGYAVHSQFFSKRNLDINQREYDLGIMNALSAKFSQDQFLVVDDLSTIQEPSDLFELLERLGIQGKSVYILHGSPTLPSLVSITNEWNEEMKIGKKEYPLNHKYLLPVHARHISTIPLMTFQYLLLDKEAVEILEEMYNRSNSHDNEEAVKHEM